MIITYHLRQSAILFLFLLTFWSCQEKETGPDTNAERKALLENIGNNIIIPTYQDLTAKTTALDAAARQFTSTPTLSTLTALQQAWKEAALAWQKSETFEFGPAAQKDLRMQVNAFPTSPAKIESAITSASTFTSDYIKALDLSAKGLPAIEFLIFDLDEDNTAILSRFTSDPNAARYKEFVVALTNYIKENVADVNNEWSASGGNYINTFITNTGTDVGSSLGYLVNQMNYHLEIVINQKIGIPSGRRSNGTIFPERVEGYYSKMSLPFIIENLRHLQNLYLGISANGDGAGLKEYIDQLKAKDGQGAALSESIVNKVETAIAAVEQIPPTLPEAIVTNKPTVDKAYNELKNLLVPFKVDMPSALGIGITYIDNDGD